MAIEQAQELARLLKENFTLEVVREDIYSYEPGDTKDVRFTVNLRLGDDVVLESNNFYVTEPR